MTTYVALLRGVNVSGHRPVPMATLRNLAASLGYRQPRTYLQSGNLVFAAPTSPAPAASALEAAINQALGHEVRVGILPARALERIIQASPLAAKSDVDAKCLHVCFLLDPFTGAQAPWSELPALAGEEVHFSKQALYLYLPHGAGKTKLTNHWFERRLSVAATTRNWRTVLALQHLAEGSPA